MSLWLIMCNSVYGYDMTYGFDIFDRYYTFDESYPGRFKVFEDNKFVCSGLTMRQAQDFCHGVDLRDLGIEELCL